VKRGVEQVEDAEALLLSIEEAQTRLERPGLGRSDRLRRADLHRRRFGGVQSIPGGILPLQS
jgi:hypothetical protein